MEREVKILAFIEEHNGGREWRAITQRPIEGLHLMVTIPRHADQAPDEVKRELNQKFRRGLRQVYPDANVIVVVEFAEPE